MKKDRKKLIKFSPKKQTKAEDRALQDGLRSARLIYDDWLVKLQNAAANGRLTIEDLADKLNDLLVKLASVRNDQAREMARSMVHGSLSKFAEYQVLMNSTMEVLIHCPHEKPPEAASTMLPKEWCDWTAATRVFKENFEKGTAEFVCPDCGGKISTSNMEPV